MRWSAPGRLLNAVWSVVYGDQVTIRQLLNHTSGVPDYVDATTVELYGGNRSRSWRPQELVALVADAPSDFPAGTAWSYSSTGYVLAGPDRRACDRQPARPSLSTSGETLTIEESMTLRARTENAGHVGDEHEWSWYCG